MQETQILSGNNMSSTGNPQLITSGDLPLQQGGAVQRAESNGFSLNSSGASSSIAIDGSQKAIQAQIAPKIAQSNTNVYIISGIIMLSAVVVAVVFMKFQKPITDF